MSVDHRAPLSAGRLGRPAPASRRGRACQDRGRRLAGHRGLLATGIHVLAYFTRAGELGLADLVRRRPLAGAFTRQVIVLAGVILGLVLAIAILGIHPSATSA